MVSTATRSDMFASATDEGLLVLLTIDHDDLSVPIRVVNNNANVQSRGDDFIAFSFDLIILNVLPNNYSIRFLEIT